MTERTDNTLPGSNGHGGIEGWFHAIDFGSNISTVDRWGNALPPNYSLYGALKFLEHIDLEGRDCLDIGTMDGLAAFSMKQKGAGTVVATDNAGRDQFLFGRKKLGLDVEYLPSTRIDDFPVTFQTRNFDLVVCAGVLYHVLDPLNSLIHIRRVTRNNGLLILETQYLYNEPGAIMSFLPTDRKRKCPSTNSFYRPSYKALIGMMELAGFEIISTISVNLRLTVLARAVVPSELKTGNDMVKKILVEYHTHRHYSEKIGSRVGFSGAQDSLIKYRPFGHRDHFIFSSRFKTDNTLQPKWNAPFHRQFQVFLMDLYCKIRSCIARRRYIFGMGR